MVLSFDDNFFPASHLSIFSYRKNGTAVLNVANMVNMALSSLKRAYYLAKYGRDFIITSLKSTSNASQKKGNYFHSLRSLGSRFTCKTPQFLTLCSVAVDLHFTSKYVSPLKSSQDSDNNTPNQLLNGPRYCVYSSL